MKTNKEIAEEIANEYIGSKYLPDCVDNKLHRLIIKQACMKMAEIKDKQRKEIVHKLNNDHEKHLQYINSFYDLDFL